MSPPFLGVPQIWRSRSGYKSIAVSFAISSFALACLPIGTQSSAATKPCSFSGFSAGFSVHLINSLPGTLEKLRHSAFQSTRRFGVSCLRDTATVTVDTAYMRLSGVGESELSVTNRKKISVIRKILKHVDDHTPEPPKGHSC